MNIILRILLTLAGMHILMAMLPGPNTVVISWLSATRSRPTLPTFSNPLSSPTASA